MLVLTTKAKKCLLNMPGGFEIIMAKARRSSISQRRRARVGARIRSCFRYHFLSSVYHAPHAAPSSSHLNVWSTATIQRLQRPPHSHITAGPRSLSKAVLRFVCFAIPSALFFRTCGSAPPNLAFAFELPADLPPFFGEETKSEVQSSE